MVASRIITLKYAFHLNLLFDLVGSQQLFCTISAGYNRRKRIYIPFKTYNAPFSYVSFKADNAPVSRLNESLLCYESGFRKFHIS